MPQQIKPLVILVLFFISSCVFLTEHTLKQTITDNSFLPRFPENKKAIIIFKLNGKKGDKIYLCEQQNIVVKDLQFCQSIYVNNQYHILMLKPSLYYFFASPKNHPIFPSNKIITQKKSLIFLEARSAEINYIGDIFYKQSIKTINSLQEGEELLVLNQQFKIVDKFTQLQKLLSGKKSNKSQQLFANQPWEINFLINNYLNLEKYFNKKLLIRISD